MRQNTACFTTVHKMVCCEPLVAETAKVTRLATDKAA